jgi:hypothetical protein
MRLPQGNSWIRKKRTTVHQRPLPNVGRGYRKGSLAGFYTWRAAVVYLLALLEGAHLGFASTPQPVHGACGFLDSLGVNTAISYANTPYTETANLLAALKYLGIRTVREGVPDRYGLAITSYARLAEAGVRFDFLINGNGLVSLSADLGNLRAFNKAHPGSIIAIEGPNEVNAWPITYKGVHDTYAAAAAVTRDLWRAVHKDPELRNIAIYAPTLAVDPVGEAALGDLSAYVTYGNAHVYASGGDNVWTNDMPYWLPIQARPTPGKPMVITETGYAMDGENFDELSGAKYLLNTLFDNAVHGIVMTYIYELVGIDPSLSVARAGLFSGDWKPKPAATALHNLGAILCGRGTDRSLSELSYHVDGLPSTARHLLLGNSAASDIVIWNDVRVWDARAHHALDAPAAVVTVEFGSPHGAVSVYDPLVGTTPVQTESDTASVTVRLLDHPVIVSVDNCQSSIFRNCLPQTGAANGRCPAMRGRSDGEIGRC